MLRPYAFCEYMKIDRKSSAGPFSVWMRRMRLAMQNETGMDVPCGTCNACCRAFYFIHIRSTEKETLRHIPKKILFPAPHSAQGDVLLGYTKPGRCPMLIDNNCTIYAHRPITCRTYDCRIFSAAGVSANDEPSMPSREIPLWRFSYPHPLDRQQHAAVKAAGRFLQHHGKELPAEWAPNNAIQLALLAIKVYDVFMRFDGSKSETPSRIGKIIKAVIQSHDTFDKRSRS
jgi:Fe-S-cluster containining protein